jgi:PhnB protein
MQEGKMAELNAYLKFDGNCKEAMEFYRGCLGGNLEMMTMGESPMGAQTPPNRKNLIMHSLLTGAGVRIMAADNMMEEKLQHGNRVNLCLVGQKKGEVEAIFEKLSKGGKVLHPLKEEFFGTYGDLTDKFGFTWMFQYGMTQMPKK